MTTVDGPQTRRLNWWNLIRTSCDIRSPKWKHITTTLLTPVLFKAEADISSLIHTHIELENFLWTRRHVGPFNGIHEMAANQPFKIIFSNSYFYWQEITNENSHYLSSRESSHLSRRFFLYGRCSLLLFAASGRPGHLGNNTTQTIQSYWPKPRCFRWVDLSFFTY